MRAAWLTGIVLLAASAATASPLTFADNRPSRLILPSQDTVVGRYALAREQADSVLLGNEASRTHYTPSKSSFGLGPIRADGAQEEGFGRRRGLRPRYRLEGVNVLGGSVGGSIDGRGAMLSLHWGGNS
jgi:hypothetical protein